MPDEAVTIGDAVFSLNPENDDDWTKVGKPSLDAVADLAGVKVKRAQVAQAVPDYDRDAAMDRLNALRSDEPAGDDVVRDADGVAKPERIVPAPPEPVDGAGTIPRAEATKSDAYAELEAAREVLAEAVKVQDTANAAVDEAQASIREVRNRFSALLQPQTFAESNAHYLNSVRKRNAAREIVMRDAQNTERERIMLAQSAAAG